MVIIVGAGPCGLAAAAAIAHRGWPHLVLERGQLVDSIARYPTDLVFFSTADRIAIAGVPFPLAAPKPTRRDALAYYRGVVTARDLVVRQEEPVSAIRAVPDGFAVTSQPVGGPPRETMARAVVLATGYFGTPNRLGVPGEALAHVTHFFREGHEGFQRDVVVVGGGNSAVEAALDLHRHGARVTVVHLGPTFDKRIKPWVLPEFEARVADGGIAVRWDTRVVAIAPGRVTVRCGERTEALPADKVYLMTGFTPSSVLVEALGIAVDAATGVPAHDPATMETSVEGVFLAGVLASGFDANKIFIENGRDHGERIAACLAARWDSP
jgi:thioredoxin reductase (NADPH)